MIVPRPAITAMKPYIPGSSIQQVQADTLSSTWVKLNQNENPLGASPRALEAVAASLPSIHQYPQVPALPLLKKLQPYWSLPEECFVVGNGSDEVFRLIGETYLNPGDKVVLPTPTFAGYALVAELMAAQVITIPLLDNRLHLSAIAEAASQIKAKAVFLCRPNSPTGTVFPADEFHLFMSLVPKGCLVILDEAYREFDDSDFDSRQFIQHHPNLIITRTFSKMYGLAGLRLGYGVMSPQIAAPIQTARDPFSVNGLALAAGAAALDDLEHQRRSIAVVEEGKSYLYTAFQRLGIEFVVSHSNFILFSTPFPALSMYNSLLSHRVLVRPCNSFGLPTSLRVTVGTREQNERFAAALSHVLEELRTMGENCRGPGLPS